MVIQVTRANKSVDVAPKDYRHLSEEDKQNMATCEFHCVIAMMKTDETTDDPKRYDGTPAAIQIIGRQHDEERLLSLAQLVVDALETNKS